MSARAITAISLLSPEANTCREVSYSSLPASSGLFHVVAAGQTSTPADDLQGVRQALAPTGALRAAFLRDNPVQGRVNPQTGEVTGLAANVVQRLATILATKYHLIPSENAASVIRSVNTGDADLGFLAYDAERPGQVDFAGGLAVMRSSYVVAHASPSAGRRRIGRASFSGPRRARASSVSELQPAPSQLARLRDAARP